MFLRVRGDGLRAMLTALRSMTQIGAAGRVCVAGALATLSIAGLGVGAGNALASAPSVPAYGEVARFGGFDTGATYGVSSTSGLGGINQQASLVYPVGMAVDTEAAGAPDEYAIYVLENINPQALNEELQSGRTTSMKLEYRIQEIADTGEVLASSRPFTLASSATEANLHAVSLAVDGADKRVYVLIADAPPASSGNTETFDAADRIDAWTTALEPVGAGELKQDSETGTGELAGPSASHPLQGAGFVGDVYGESIAVDGDGTNAELALAGNEFTSDGGSSEPIIELIKTEAANAGEVADEWKDAAATEDAAAQAIQQESSKLYSASANPDGSLNVSLGPEEQAKLNADVEPNMATVSTGLTNTSPVLPWANAAEDTSPHETEGSGGNVDRAATDGFLQYIRSNAEEFQAFGSTPRAGTLAPSVVQLAAAAPGSDSGVYAGLVANGGIDGQDPVAHSHYSWVFAGGLQENGIDSLSKPASLGIRIFDADGGSLGMIGNVTPSGTCNLQSSPSGGFGFGYGGGSFVALTPGRDGILFALVQPDLINTSESLTEPISPASPVGDGMGDQIVEFAPEGSTGIGANASKWQECPQPSGGFSVANETAKTAVTTGTAPLTVPVNTKLKLDAGDIDNRGGAIWAYDWDLENGAAGGIANRAWTINNEFTETPGQGEAWEWPSPVVEHTYATPGSYMAKLSFVSDFGTLTAEREVKVAKDEPITGVKILPAAGATAGSAVALKASATVPQFDSIVDYRWEFGDGEGEDTTSPEAQPVYAAAGEYHVQLTVTDGLGQKEKAETTVVVAPAPAGGQEKSKEKVPPPGNTTMPTTTTTTTTAATTPIVRPGVVASKPKPLSTAQKLALALKQCKKVKAKKKRVSCETQAKRKYAPPKKKKSKKGH
jgi:PKD repeat protein